MRREHEAVNNICRIFSRKAPKEKTKQENLYLFAEFLLIKKATVYLRGISHQLKSGLHCFEPFAVEPI